MMGGNTVFAAKFTAPGVSSERALARKPGAGTRSRDRRLRRAQTYLLTQLEQPFRLSDLAEAMHCSGRSLQIVFAQVYGVGPREWFHVTRLNAVYRELRDRGAADTRIAEVAMRWGFNHLGRFSIEYRKLFGEKPSDTLERSRGHRAERSGFALFEREYAVQIGSKPVRCDELAQARSPLQSENWTTVG
jgi:AraC-like DNA-binding protein